MKKRLCPVYKEIEYETVEVVVYLTMKVSSELNQRAKKIKKERLYSLPFVISSIMKKFLDDDFDSPDFISEFLSFDDGENIPYPTWEEMRRRHTLYLSHEDVLRLIKKSGTLIEAYDFSRDYSLSQTVEFLLNEAFLVWNRDLEMYDRFVESFFPLDKNV